MPISHMLTLEQREEFYRYLEKWIEPLGLQRWNVARSNKKSKYLAEVEFQEAEHKMATVRLGDKWGSTEPTPRELESTAVHELLHILLKDFKDACVEHPHDETLQLNKEHEVVNTLEKLLMKRGA